MSELLTGYKYSGQMKSIEDYGHPNHIGETILNNFEHMLRTEGGYSGPELDERMTEGMPAILNITMAIILEAQKETS